MSDRSGGAQPLSARLKQKANASASSGRSVNDSIDLVCFLILVPRSNSPAALLEGH